MRNKGNLVTQHLLLAVLGALVAAAAGLVLMDALPAAMGNAIEQAFK